MATCKIEERDAGRAYPRTCPTCKLGPCRKGHSKALAPTPKENPMTQNYEALGFISLRSEETHRVIDEVNALIRTQAARIAELEAELEQEIIKRASWEHAARHVEAERDALTAALEADGIAARKATAKNYARAEAAEAEFARLREALGDALDAWDTHNETGDMMQGYWVSDARAALAQKEAGE